MAKAWWAFVEKGPLQRARVQIEIDKVLSLEHYVTRSTILQFR